MNLLPRPAVVVLLLLPCATPVLARETTPPEPGTRVRLTLPCAAPLAGPTLSGSTDCRIEGRLEQLSPDGITLTSESSRTRHSLASVTRIEVSQGERSRWLAGAGAGFFAGAVGTYVALNRGGSTNPCDSSANQDAMGQGACLGLAAAGGLAGAGLGALVGNLFRSERWEEIPKDRWRVSVAPQAAPQLQLVVALTF
jgi:hypothetical protein